MKIDGKAIAAHLFQDLQKRVHLLKKKHITPHLVIILVGDNPASVSYVKRKQLKAQELGAKATVMHYESKITNQGLLKIIHELNSDKNIHGIIVQRPLPSHIDSESINQAVLPLKDIDAFHANTPFDMPLSKAAWLLIESVCDKLSLHAKKIVVIGKGETGGGPIITLLKKHGIHPIVIDSKTQNPEKLTKQAEIIISAVGKKEVIKPNMLKKGVILISIGQHKQTDGKFHGDYEDETIEPIASYYSPTPGGVGPVNVICLLDNLLKASEMQT